MRVLFSVCVSNKIRQWKGGGRGMLEERKKASGYTERNLQAVEPAEIRSPANLSIHDQLVTTGGYIEIA